MEAQSLKKAKMKVTPDTPFHVDGIRVACVLVTRETGEPLENVASVDTETGEYEQYLIGHDGGFVFDDLGRKLTVTKKADQFYFTVTVGPRNDIFETDGRPNNAAVPQGEEKC